MYYELLLEKKMMVSRVFIALDIRNWKTCLPINKETYSLCLVNRLRAGEKHKNVTNWFEPDKCYCVISLSMQQKKSAVFCPSCTKTRQNINGFLVWLQAYNRFPTRCVTSTTYNSMSTPLAISFTALSIHFQYVIQRPIMNVYSYTP